ncbi:MAG TPA: MFS transporter [Candidatus Dormibacteraeota bacterium]|nr:MFS transporter [Candidatus Dormibacteraeota bacterium]
MTLVRDRAILYVTGFLRAFATGMVGVLLGLYLARLGFGPALIGAIVGIGLAGAAGATLAVTMVGDRFPRRGWLIGLSLLSAGGTLVVAGASSGFVLAVAAALGMLNGMGRDRGAALVVEQAALPATTDDHGRTTAFAWLGVLQDGGHALGGLAAGLPALLGRGDDVATLRLTMAVPAVLALVSALLYVRLSPAIEPVAAAASGRRLSPESRGIVARLAALFAVDSIAGGFLATALLAYFLAERFAVGGGLLGPLFFVARVANAGSHLTAAWLARRIGLVNTMVFTHIPSSVLLITIPWAPNFPVAAALFVLREALVEMDVPTRQSYTMAVVRPEERTTAAGVTNLVRLAGWAVGPAVAGALMQGGVLAGPLYVGAAMKIAYDLLLYRAFRGIPPPEEVVKRPRPSPQGGAC